MLCSLRFAADYFRYPFFAFLYAFLFVLAGRVLRFWGMGWVW